MYWELVWLYSSSMYLHRTEETWTWNYRFAEQTGAKSLIAFNEILLEIFWQQLYMPVSYLRNATGIRARCQLFPLLFDLFPENIFTAQYKKTIVVIVNSLTEIPHLLNDIVECSDRNSNVVISDTVGIPWSSGEVVFATVRIKFSQALSLEGLL